MAADRRSAREPERPEPQDDARASAAGTDLAGAILVAAVALAVMLGSVGLEMPDTQLTAPGLLPLVTSLALLAMAGALALRAVRAGALTEPGRRLAAAAGRYRRSAEERRAWLLGAIVLAYVVLVGNLSIELRVPFTSYPLSGYELVSVAVVTVVLKLFWRAGLLRCLLVAVLGVEALALAFRYGFNVIMPEAF